MNKKLKSELDKWISTRQGKRLQVGAPGEQYLRRRLEEAFVAGWRYGRLNLVEDLRK